MSAPKHTPEPWSVNGSCVFAKDSTISIAQADDYGKSRNEQLANAARIVACVNACAGIPTDTLQAARAAYDAAGPAIGILQRERDALAAALRSCVDNYYNSEGDEQSCARAGRAALAALDGKP